jgi:DNA-binding transcriptional LysR family regulator
VIAIQGGIDVATRSIEAARLSAHVNLLDLDLNLLIALDALLTERSVTRAAVALHRSQPALSASLKRLRRQFGDDLLVRVGNNHELTPLAQQLKSRVALVLADIERVFGTRAQFDAQASDREFVIMTADYGQMMLGCVIAAELARDAPHVRVRYRPLSDTAINEADDTLRAVDGFILPHGFVHDMPFLDAYSDRWIILADGANTVIGDSVTLQDLTRLEWVLAFHRQGSHVPPVRQLQLLGVDLRVVVAVEGFVSLPAFVAGTERVTIMQERLARTIAPAPGFRTIECPFDAVPLTEALWWHPAVEHDPGHAWFREVVRRAGERIAAG